MICEHCGHKLTVYTYKKKTHHYFYCIYCKVQGISLKGCRSDRVEQKILEYLKSKKEDVPSQKSNKSLVYLMSQLKSQKFSYYQDYKDKKINRETYIYYKQEIEKKIDDIEEELNKFNNSQCLIDSSLSKETLRASVKQIIVNHAGG